MNNLFNLALLPDRREQCQILGRPVGIDGEFTFTIFREGLASADNNDSMTVIH